MGNDGGQWDLMGYNVTIWCFSADSAVYAKPLKSAKNTLNHGLIHRLPMKSQERSMGTHGMTIKTCFMGSDGQVFEVRANSCKMPLQFRVTLIRHP